MVKGGLTRFCLIGESGEFMAFSADQREVMSPARG
jgi:hypothetical protein